MLRTNDLAVDAAGSASWAPGSAALPVCFAGTVGLFTPSMAGTTPSDCAALFLSPWGFEEMCTRKLWRELAEGFAGLGIASLRFDYPGTGDSLDPMEFSGGLPVWQKAIGVAAAELRMLSGARRLILVGQGLGATFSILFGRQLGAVEATVLMAPVVSGRFYLRELSAWSKMVDDGLGLTEEQRLTGKTSVAGLVMPDDVAAAVRAINLQATDAAPAGSILMVHRPARDNEAALAARLEELGAAVCRKPYLGYDELVSNPTLAIQPETVMQHVTEWVGTLAAAAGPARGPQLAPPPAVLEGDGFAEESLRFGPAGRLSGILCRPAGPRRGAAVILLGTAYDRHAGWARSTVDTARLLARQGVASLRFDAANVGDSPPVDGAAGQVLFSEGQRDDVRAAFDLMAARQLTPAVLAGRCSGAYLAFQSAIDEPRCRSVVAVNPFTFVWDRDEEVDAALRYNPRSLGDYRKRALRLDTLRRLALGQIDLRRAAANIGKQLGRRVALMAPGPLGCLSKYGRLRQAVLSAFRSLAERRVPVRLIYSDTDVGLERYHAYFGADGSGMKAFANVTVEIVPDADHNLSPPAARALLQQRILEAALAAD
ncbi:alpha/beta hydrolase [Rhizobium sp. TRM96647]|uniref:alpha/beta hydrolase n=1 Tax=unclassified Rhizobium TaxID=2613769 RepID=UPI0021E8D0A3|nr:MULTISPECIES: alpha/beta hydrolase [unclassified Rhizobium]MCV3736314.1 alpha/beta hydrolase [Rhizobium sp. TRM96647]MCV3758683.1 alpha/beta hydrolase [Rhizobium sp. TRM96650]